MPDTAYVERDGTIATIILNRPELLNALDLDTATLLVRHLQGSPTTPAFPRSSSPAAAGAFAPVAT